MGWKLLKARGTKLAFFIFLIFIVMVTFAQAEEQRQVRIASQMPAANFGSIAVDRFCADAERLSNGTLKFLHYPAGQLYKPEDLVDVLPAGGVEMAQIALNRFSGVTEMGNFLGPFFCNEDQFVRWWYDPSSGGGFYYSHIQPAFEKINIHLISMLNYSPDHCTITKKPIKGMDDFKGLKIRSSGRNFGTIVEGLGAKAIVMSSSDVYTAIQRGTIDGAMSGASSFVSRKWYEMANHVQVLNVGNVTHSLSANINFWKSLKPYQRYAIEEAARLAEIWCMIESQKDHFNSLEIMRKNGLKIIELPVEEMGMFGMQVLEKAIKPEIGEQAWNAAAQARVKVKNGEKGWVEVLISRKM